MSAPYKILIIEDSDTNGAIAVYINSHCAGHIGELRQVDTLPDFIIALDEKEWDIILSDYRLKGMTAADALKVINRQGIDVPLIVVSDREEEQGVMSVLYAGAEHFIMKNDMERLCITVPRSIANSRRRREINSELKNYRRHLEDLVAERTEELEKANENLQLEVGKRKRTEDALRERESQYRNLIENAHDGICIVQDQKLKFVNRHFEQMLGYENKSTIDSSFFNYGFMDEQERIVGVYRKIIKGEATVLRCDTAFVKKNGQRVEVSMSASAIDYQGRRAVMIVVRDITEQNRARRMALESERLEAVGVVARGVGNNFANIMNVISSYAVSISDSFLPHTKPHDSARRILDATHHASVLTKRLLSVVQVSETESGKMKLEQVPLGDVINKARGLVAHSLQSKAIEVVIKPRALVPYVFADRDQLLDTLISIFMNAVDAMPDGGKLVINLVERKIARPRSNPDSEGGHFVGLSIRDNGVGMTKEQLARAFEPFFTTKGSGDAFGLGLPVAQSLAQGWGGWIDIRSRPGRGTRVRIFMKKTEDPTANKVPDESQLPTKVLVVDDNEGRRKLMVEALAEQGHVVIEAANGDDAIRLHREHADSIGLAVVDWLLPGTDGKGVLRAIFEHDPQARVIMVSGFSRDYVRSEVRIGAWGFLQKPFSKADFLKAVEKERLRKNS